MLNYHVLSEAKFVVLPSVLHRCYPPHCLVSLAFLQTQFSLVKNEPDKESEHLTKRLFNILRDCKLVDFFIKFNDKTIEWVCPGVRRF